MAPVLIDSCKCMKKSMLMLWKRCSCSRIQYSCFIFQETFLCKPLITLNLFYKIIRDIIQNKLSISFWRLCPMDNGQWICPVVGSSSSASSKSEINQASVCSVYNISDYKGFYLLLKSAIKWLKWAGPMMGWCKIICKCIALELFIFKWIFHVWNHRFHNIQLYHCWCLVKYILMRTFKLHICKLSYQLQSRVPCIPFIFI